MGDEYPAKREREEGGVATTMATKKAVATKIQVKVVDEQAAKPVYLCDIPVGTVFTGSIDGTAGVFVKTEGNVDSVFCLNTLRMYWLDYDVEDEITNYKVRHDVKIEVK